MIIFRVTTGRAAGRDLKGNAATTNVSTGLVFNPSSRNGEHSTVADDEHDKKKDRFRSRSQGFSTIDAEKRDDAQVDVV
jgi:hypothetical protein